MKKCHDDIKHEYVFHIIVFNVEATSIIVKGGSALPPSYLKKKYVRCMFEENITTVFHCYVALPISISCIIAAIIS